MSNDLIDNIRQVARKIAAAQRVCCLTGAGVSAESGVPTFRDHGGLWEGRRPEEVATPEAFAADPEDVWRFYCWRRQELSRCKPNPGHYALAQLEEIVPKFTLITQNVDGLHREAGSRDIIELHGDLLINRCTGARRSPGQAPCPEIRVPLDSDFDEIPFCPECGSMMRPGVVWFGEMLPFDALSRADRLASQCQIMLVVGTSAVVYPAAGLADVAAAAGAAIVEVNPAATALSSSADHCLAGPSGEILPTLIEELVELKQ